MESSEKGCVGGTNQAGMPVRCESTVGESKVYLGL
jgi:hypothetical protein